MKRELAEALIEQCTERLTGWDERRGNYTETFVDKHKLIEMVVRECAKVVDETPFGYTDYRNQIEEGQRNACVNALLYHFGIEK